MIKEVIGERLRGLGFSADTLGYDSFYYARLDVSVFISGGRVNLYKGGRHFADVRFSNPDLFVKIEELLSGNN